MSDFIFHSDRVLDYDWDKKEYKYVENERPRSEYPYSYTCFISWSDFNVIPNGSVYTDRLWQWNSHKYDKLCNEHFGDKGQCWSGRNSKKVQEFLRDYLDKPNLKLAFIKQSCNRSNGFPYWCLAYNHGE